MTTRLGEKIRTLRKEKRMTLDDLAGLADMSKSYLWELENRESPRPSAEKVLALANALSTHVSFFLDDASEKPSPSHLDAQFYRNYDALDPDAKEQMRRIVETFKRS